MKLAMIYNALLTILIVFSITNSVYSNEERINTTIGFTYNSIYWWRGIELNGKGAGVLWPKIALSVWNTTVYTTVGINQDYLMATEKGDKQHAKTFHEFDYGIEYAYISNAINTTIGVKFTHYPFYDSAGASVNPSFFEGYIIASYISYFVPTLEVYYDHFVEENNNTPINQDVYIKASIFKDLMKVNNFICKLGAWIAYYNNAYLDRKGMSDAGLTIITGFEHNQTTFSSAINYARTLSKDFYMPYDADNNSKVSKLKNHLWVDFGISIKL